MSRGFGFRRTGLHTDNYPINIKMATTTQNATGSGSSGSVTCSMPMQGDTLKKVIVYFNNFKHTNATGLTYTFPVPFVFAPARIVDITNNACTITTTGITFPASMANAVTGWLILEGY